LDRAAIRECEMNSRFRRGDIVARRADVTSYGRDQSWIGIIYGRTEHKYLILWMMCGDEEHLPRIEVQPWTIFHLDHEFDLVP
jgi:hypothetical protein